MGRCFKPQHHYLKYNYTAINKKPSGFMFLLNAANFISLKKKTLQILCIHYFKNNNILRSLVSYFIISSSNREICSRKYKKNCCIIILMVSVKYQVAKFKKGLRQRRFSVKEIPWKFKCNL